MSENKDKPVLSLAVPVKIRTKKGKKPRKNTASQTPKQPIKLSYVPQLPANRIAAYEVAAWVILHHHYLDKALAEHEGLQKLYPSDRQFVRMLVTSLLRHHKQLSDIVSSFIKRPPPPDALLILMMGAAQLLLLRTPTHAALSTTVDLMRAAGFEHMTGMANAVLRKISQGNFDLLTADSLADNIHPSIMQSWQKAYSKERVAQFLPQLFTAPKIDLSFADDNQAAAMAKAKGGQLLTPKSLRAELDGTITSWPGFDDGHWWVQDIAASMPATLFGAITGKKVIDMCAAPGGKTAQLIAGGGQVTAIEIDPKRARRLEENLKRLKMSCVIAVTDALTYQPEDKVDAVLLDAPCSATGTIRKRPDVMQKDISEDLKTLPELQMEMAKKALSWLADDGILVYATCSLQAEEGEHIIRALTQGERPVAEILPISEDEAGPFAKALTTSGTLRLLPDSLSFGGGNDGFFIARLRRNRS